MGKCRIEKERSCHIIIIEGADHSGKSFLANHIAEEFGLCYLHSKGPSLDLFDQLLDTMVSDPQFTFQKTVFDRFFFSELVYGPILRGKICFTQQQRELLYHLLMTCEPLIIRAGAIRSGFETRTHSVSKEDNELAAMRFKEVMGEGPLKYRTHFYDANVDQPDKFDNLVRVHLAGIAGWIQWRRRTSHGRGPRSASVVLVGENFAKNSSKRTPFERSKSALLVHAAINSTAFAGFEPWSKIYITNADATGAGLSQANLTRLKDELNAMENAKKIIALGSQASAALEKIKVKHLRVNHPAFFVRIGAEQGFIDALRKALGVTST